MQSAACFPDELPLVGVLLETVVKELVCEVNFEKLQNGRFRHAARFLRWRTDKDPKDCDFAQLEPPESFSLDDIFS